MALGLSSHITEQARIEAHDVDVVPMFNYGSTLDPVQRIGRQASMSEALGASNRKGKIDAPTRRSGPMERKGIMESGCRSECALQGPLAPFIYRLIPVLA